MSETPDNPPEEPTGRKRAKGVKRERPAAPVEKGATAGESASNFIDFSANRSGRGKEKPADSAAKKAAPRDRDSATPAGEASSYPRTPRR